MPAGLCGKGAASDRGRACRAAAKIFSPARIQRRVPLADGHERMHAVADAGTGLLGCEDPRLRDCIGALDDAPRQALLLSFFDRLTHRELAQRLRHPLGTVKAWICRSLPRPQACMEG